jgi:MFS family permease
LAGLVRVEVNVLLSVMYVYFGEVFPSEFRAIATSLASIIGRFGGIVAPQVANVTNAIGLIPQITFAITGIIGVFVGYRSTETFKGGAQQLKDSTGTLDNEVGEYSGDDHRKSETVDKHGVHEDFPHESHGRSTNF